MTTKNVIASAGRYVTANGSIAVIAEGRKGSGMPALSSFDGPDMALGHVEGGNVPGLKWNVETGAYFNREVPELDIIALA